MGLEDAHAFHESIFDAVEHLHQAGADPQALHLKAVSRWATAVGHTAELRE